MQNFGQLEAEELLGPLEHLLPKKEEKELLYSSHLEQESVVPEVTADAVLKPVEEEQESKVEDLIEASAQMSLEENAQPLTSPQTEPEPHPLPTLETEQDSFSAETTQTSDFSLLEATTLPPMVAEGTTLTEDGMPSLEAHAKPVFYIESPGEQVIPPDSQLQDSEKTLSEEM